MLHYSFAERYQEKAKVVIDLVNSKFAELDADGNGMLDEGELSALTEGAGAERTTAEAVKLFFAMADKVRGVTFSLLCNYSRNTRL
eukprot:SAG31_NODE_104_length_25069_cov_12.917144_23_plen_86_part_00